MRKFGLAVGVLVLCLLLPISGWAINDWTVIMYMSGDDAHTDIEVAQLQNMLAVTKLNLPKGIEVIAQIDRGPKVPALEKTLFTDCVDRGAFRYNLLKNSIYMEKRLGEVNLGSPYVLWDCLNWAVKDHPARHYFLIMNSHGSGAFSWSGQGNVGAPHPGQVVFNPGRFVGYDDTNEDCLTVFEISAVLKAFRDKLNGGRKCDLVGFDACLAGGIEVLYQFRDVFDFMVGCPDETAIEGLNYKAIIGTLAKDPKIKPEKLAALSADSNKIPSATPFGAWKTATAQDVVFSLSNLSMELLNAMKQTGNKLQLKGFADYGGDKRYWDLKKFLDGFAHGSVQIPGAENNQLINKVAKEASDALSQCRVSSRGSLSISMPSKKEYLEFKAFYKALDFSKTAKWDEVLDLQEQ